MSYNAKEIGEITGNPIELYRFANAADAVLLAVTSGDEEITYAAQLYSPYTITRSNLSLQSEPRGQALIVRVPRDNTVAALWLQYSPQDSVWLTIFRRHRDDADNEVKTVWKGRVRGVSWQGSEAILECEPLISLLKRPCLRATYQTLCNHQLGDARCSIDLEAGLDPEGVAFKQAVVISSVDGLDYLSPGLDANTVGGGTSDPPYDTFFTGGYAVDTVTGERRFIVAHVGLPGAGDGYITLWQAFSGVAATDSINVYAGCGRSASICASKFNNIVNFGGFPAMPYSNPFTRGIM